jgi:hypothetical protein
MDVKSLFESLKKLIDVKIDTYSKSVSQSLSAFEERVGSLEKGFDNITLQKGEKGDKGDKGEDGKSIEIADVMPSIKSLIVAEINDLPVPKDGVDGKDGRDGIDGKNAEIDYPALTQSLVDELKESKGFISSVTNLVPVVNGVDGKDGKDVDIEYVDQKLHSLFTAHETSSFDLIKSLVESQVKEIPIPKDGKDGLNGKDGVDGKNAYVDYTAIGQTIAEQIKNIKLPEAKEINIDEIVNIVLEKMPFPKDGKDGKDGSDGKAGEKGKDGVDGKDALELHILESVDLDKSYPRSTYATIKGGLFKAFRATDPLQELDDFERKGWTCIVKGIDSITVDFKDDENKLYLNIENSLGTVVQKEVKLPIPKYKNIWDKDATYAKDHIVTSNGSMWISNTDNNTDRPGLSEAWTMCVKKGRDGKDGAKGKDGLNGKDGKDGQDLTQISENGAKY